jgi:alkylhydroperoxidase/carboxymuconolactone decarboxylase family protein YurZ/quercetin dioxygenase-like cupin family protein
MSEKIVQTAGRNQLGEFAPMFAHLNDDVLFGEVWNDRAIDLKTRCIVTVVSLMASGVTDSSLSYHLQNAKAHGVTKEEAAAIITQAAVYTGWPRGWAALRLAMEVWKEQTPAKSDREIYQQSIFFPIGQPNDAFAPYFVGQSYLAPVSAEQVPMFNVTFEPGCRNNWHIHTAKSGGGQMLICVGGRGYCQVWGRDAVEMLPGSIVHIPAGVKHWHGAAPDRWFSHLAVEVAGEGTGTEWLEPVSEADYGRLDRRSSNDP